MGSEILICNKFSGDATGAVGCKDLQQPSDLTGEENEVQRDKGTCPRLHSPFLAESGKIISSINLTPLR